MFCKTASVVSQTASTEAGYFAVIRTQFGESGQGGSGFSMLILVEKSDERDPHAVNIPAITVNKNNLIPANFMIRNRYEH